VIEARVRPQDIDHVKIGQPAIVRLTALSKRLTPMISGDVIYVSADALPDDKRGVVAPTDAYIVRARLNPLEVTQIEGFQPTPGMPAELYVKTKERTFFEYLTQPIRDSMSRAFREW
jgi:HlyD family secretion protein